MGKKLSDYLVELIENEKLLLQALERYNNNKVSREYLAHRLIDDVKAVVDFEGKYYLQNGFVGDIMFFWRIGNAGYTSNPDEAQLFTKDQAYRQHNMRSQDIPWPAGYIRERMKCCVKVYSVCEQEASEYHDPEI